METIVNENFVQIGGRAEKDNKTKTKNKEVDGDGDEEG